LGRHEVFDIWQELGENVLINSTKSMCERGDRNGEEETTTEIDVVTA
jgi:hypothetical protein